MTDNPTTDPQFGSDHCTCIPFTWQTDPPRILNRPTDTVDMISGWERGRDCPHYAPKQTDFRDCIAAALSEARRPGLGGMTEADAVAYMAAAVLAVLPPPADRAAVLREAADIADETVPPDLPRDDRDQGRADAAADIRRWADHVEQEALPRMAAEAQQPTSPTVFSPDEGVHGRDPYYASSDTETPGCWCRHPEDRHWHDQSGRMTFPDGCHDCPGWNGAHAYGQELPWLPEGDEPPAAPVQPAAADTDPDPWHDDPKANTQEADLDRVDKEV